MAEPISERKLVARIGARICWHGREIAESHQRIGNAIDENTYVHATFTQSKTVNGCFKTAVRRRLDFELILKKRAESDIAYKVLARAKFGRESAVRCSAILPYTYGSA